MAERGGRLVASGSGVAPAAAVLVVQLWLFPVPASVWLGSGAAFSVGSGSPPVGSISPSALSGSLDHPGPRPVS